MARKCVCKGCGKHLTTDIAYKVIHNNKNIYYCTKEEYDKLQKYKEDRDECLMVVAEILNLKFVPPSLVKQLSILNEYYEYAVITKTFKDYTDKIQWFLNNKASNNDFANFKYVMTIVTNNINAVYKRYKNEQKQLQKLRNCNKTNDLDFNIMNDIATINNSNVTDISDFLD